MFNVTAGVVTTMGAIGIKLPIGNGNRRAARTVSPCETIGFVSVLAGR
jgi:hypothetical protein